MKGMFLLRPRTVFGSGSVVSVYPHQHCRPHLHGEPTVRVELTGPDDLGVWYLTNAHGNAFPLVESHEGHPAAAALFGWQAPEGVEDREAIIQDALVFLMDHIGDEIEAPKEAVDYLSELEEEDEE